ncbi:MAG: beta-ketoacyl-ACP synthase III [Candidatus Neomarinimicrobiota bacterium]
MRASITATAKYAPDRILSNADLEKMVDTTDEWIISRTGIRERRIASKGEVTSFMSTEVAKILLEKSGVDPSEVEIIIVATVTPDMLFPSTAALIQDNIGARNAWGFDLSAACSGFIFALETGAKFIESGQYRKVIVIGADTMSSVVDYEDRETCVLFGDGAGGVLLEPAGEEDGILDSLLYLDGSGGDLLKMPAGGSLHPASRDTLDKRMHFLQQRGRQVYKFAVKGMTEATEVILTRNGLTGEDIRLFVPHQANKRIIDACCRRLGLSPGQVLVNIDRYANTTAGTVPIALAEAVETNRLGSGEYVILAAFGAGLTWGSVLIRWGDCK